MDKKSICEYAALLGVSVTRERKDAKRRGSLSKFFYLSKYTLYRFQGLGKTLKSIVQSHTWEQDCLKVQLASGKGPGRSPAP